MRNHSEPWILKNAFWLLALFCGFMAIFGFVRDKELAVAVSLILGGVSIFLARHYHNLNNVKKRNYDKYKKTHYYQARRRGLKIIRGGKK